MGRIGMFLQGNTDATPAQLVERANLANALLIFLRGGATTYYGDEKGMTGTGGDKAARQDMFPTQVVEWQKETRIGSSPIGTKSAFDVINPIETNLAELQKLTLSNPALRSGTQQLRYANDGAFAVSRYANKQEYLVAFNGRDNEAKLNLNVSTADSKWSVISGKANDLSASSKSVSMTLPARSWVVLKADSEFAPTTKLAITLNKPTIDIRTSEQYVALTASVPGTDFTEVTFAVREKGKAWSIVGTSDRSILGVTGFKDGLYRVYLHPSKYKKGTSLEVVAIAVNANGEKIASALQSYLIK
jgi:hypothetical protein